MTDAAPAPKVKKVAKPKKPATHPKYSEMISAALGALKERSGSSRQAILKYILANYKLGYNVTAINAHLKMALKAGVKSGTIKQSKGTGASGSFKLGEQEKAAKKAAKPKAAKPKKAKTPNFTNVSSVVDSKAEAVEEIAIPECQDSEINSDLADPSSNESKPETENKLEIRSETEGPGLELSTGIARVDSQYSEDSLDDIPMETSPEDMNTDTGSENKDDVADDFGDETRTPETPVFIEETVDRAKRIDIQKLIPEPEDIYGHLKSIANFHERILRLKRKDISTETEHEASKTPDKLKEEAETSEGVLGEADKLYEKQIEESEAGREGEKETFVWEKYLLKTGAGAVSPSAFKHVESSLQSGIQTGMKLEVNNRSDPTTYWLATVLETCGPSIKLRYDCYKEEDITAEFWCDINSSDIHPVGWCAQNSKSLKPPDEISDSVEDWHEHLRQVLSGSRTAPAYVFEKGLSSCLVDQIKCGMRLEIQNILDPTEVWIVQILENVGGRLYLRLEGTESASKHFWVFYLNPRLHYVGWAEQQGYSYNPPHDIREEQSEEQWAEILNQALEEAKQNRIPEEIFKDQREPKPHSFTVGMKLEALIPGVNGVGPATVAKVINDKYFLVEIDDLREEARESIKLCCHSEYLGIFPVSWCQCKGIRLIAPPGWKSTEFVWGEYLSKSGAKAAPEKLFNSGTDEHEFERGMKLEAVNPNNPNQICAATITKIVGPLLWIHMDHMRDIPSHIEDIDSHRLFPVGWCESNHFQIKPPVRSRHSSQTQSDTITREIYKSVVPNPVEEEWCPKLYFNHRCFSGPYLSKGRVADLPKSVGPGPLTLLLKEALGLFINVAYKSCRVLKEIQLEGKPNTYMKACALKAKYKGKKYCGVVEVCTQEELMEEYLRNICIKLECCPYIISPLHVKNNCPENCQQMTKTKYNSNYANKKRRPGTMMSCARPVSKAYSGLKRGRKKKAFLLTYKKCRRPTVPRVGREVQNDIKPQDDEGFIDGEENFERVGGKRKHYNQQYEIQTRGAKLPRYSFERRTHKKIYRDPVAERRPMYRVSERILQPREGSLILDSNPLHWSVDRLAQHIKATDCSHLARVIKEQEVDGQAFMLMDLATIQDHLDLKLGPAVKLCHQIERIKVAFYEQFS